MATNDPGESPFACLTHQLQSFGHLLGIHSSAVGHARINRILPRLQKISNDGAYHQLPMNMRHSLMRLALTIAPAVCKAKKTSLDKQHAAKKKK